MRFVNLVSLFAKQKNSKFPLLLPAVTAYVMFINETHRSFFGVHSITKYFKQYPKEIRNSTTYFVRDMWRTYADISDVWLKNATKVIDNTIG